MGSVAEMAGNVDKASQLLKALANKDRLMILCHLAEGELCVSDLEEVLLIRQPTLSQQLARLRHDDLVRTRREGKVIYYSLGSSEAGQVIDLLYSLYCARQPVLQTAEADREEKKRAFGDLLATTATAC